MHPEPVALGHRVDQPAERHPLGDAEVVALAVEDPPAERRGEPLDRRRHLAGEEPGGVDQQRGREPHPLAAALGLDLEALRRRAAPRPAGWRRRSCRPCPRARPGRRASARGCRRCRSRARAAPPPRGAPAPAARSAAASSGSSSSTPFAARRRGDAGERALLLRLGRDDDLAGAAVRHAVRGAVARRASPGRGRRAAPSPSPAGSRCRRGSPRNCASWCGCRSAARPRAPPPRGPAAPAPAPPRARPRPRPPPRTPPDPSLSSISRARHQEPIRPAAATGARDRCPEARERSPRCGAEMRGPRGRAGHRRRFPRSRPRRHPRGGSPPPPRAGRACR